MAWDAGKRHASSFHPSMPELMLNEQAKVHTFGSQGDEIGAGQFLPLSDRKADVASAKFPCAAAIGWIVCFLMHKQTFGPALPR
jgi:hypothetical protein